MSQSQPTALILAVTSDIGRAIARRYAEAGYNLIVTARNPERLAAETADLQARCSVQVHGELLDIENPEDVECLLAGLDPLPDVTLCAIGLMPNQQEAQADPALAARAMHVNYIGPSLLLEQIAQRCQARGSGSIVGISSVAGDRGRGSNYVYGSAKAGFSAYLSGLRNRLHGSGVHVMTVKPGFTKTRMTEGMKLPGLLTASSQELAASTLSAQAGKKHVLYHRKVWRLVMCAIKALPESIFKRSKL